MQISIVIASSFEFRKDDGKEINVNQVNSVLNNVVKEVIETIEHNTKNRSELLICEPIIFNGEHVGHFTFSK